MKHSMRQLRSSWRTPMTVGWLTGASVFCPPAPAQEAVEAPQTYEVPHTVPVDGPASSDESHATGDPANAETKTPHIDEIVVTAQRREESAQDVAISMTVFDQEQLTKANVTDINDLTKYTPSLASNSRMGPDNSTFTIRGVTQELRTTASVGVYFAEVVAPRGQTVQSSGDGAGPGEFFDLRNVQVLKGPQGTLFGRNTTGGAVLLVPEKPGDEFEGYVELTGGNLEARRAQAVVNIPVTDAFKLRMGIDSNQRDGFLKNASGIGPDELANTDYIAGRLSALWDITDALTNYTIVSYSDSDNHGYSGKLFACNAASPFALLVGTSCQDQLDRQAASGHAGFYDVVSTLPEPITVIKQGRLINTTTWDVTDHLALKNILAYAHLRTKNSMDTFGTQWHAIYDVDPEREFKVAEALAAPGTPTTTQQTMVEELQVQGQSLDDRLQWQAGAYYERSKPDGYSGGTVAPFMSCDMSTLEGPPSEFNCFDLTNGRVGFVMRYKLKTDYFNKALYAQGTYEITDRLSATLGVRYTWDKTEGFGSLTHYNYVGPVQLAPETFPTAPSVKSDAPTGLIELSYRPLDDVMTYAKYVRGYRQGSVNVLSNPGIDTWKPEHMDAYEVGAKTTFGGVIPGRFNLALFYNEIDDQQLQAGYLSSFSGATTSIFNAGKSRISGAEVEATFLLLSDLTLNLSYSHLNTKLLTQKDNQARVQEAAGLIAGQTYTATAVEGDSLPYAPDDTVVVSLNYDFPLSSAIGAVGAGLTYVYTGEQRAVASGSSPFDVLDSRSLLNANLNWNGIFGMPLDLSVFATNLLDEEYIAFLGGTYSLGLESVNVGQPRMVGARLKYRFGAYGK